MNNNWYILSHAIHVLNVPNDKMHLKMFDRQAIFKKNYISA